VAPECPAFAGRRARPDDAPDCSCANAWSRDEGEQHASRTTARCVAAGVSESLHVILLLETEIWSICNSTSPPQTSAAWGRPIAGDRNDRYSACETAGAIGFRVGGTCQCHLSHQCASKYHDIKPLSNMTHRIQKPEPGSDRVVQCVVNSDTSAVVDSNAERGFDCSSALCSNTALCGPDRSPAHSQVRHCGKL